MSLNSSARGGRERQSAAFQIGSRLCSAREEAADPTRRATPLFPNQSYYQPIHVVQKLIKSQASSWWCFEFRCCGFDAGTERGRLVDMLSEQAADSELVWIVPIEQTCCIGGAGLTAGVVQIGRHDPLLFQCVLPQDVFILDGRLHYEH